ncbi:MAG: protein kinase [Planctomycetes bacterium]|nr:protein kinase [Planctomycetota bacterium]
MPDSSESTLPPISSGGVSELFAGSVADTAHVSVDGYEVLRLLGEGGMGTVWRAVQISTRRQVALKLMRDRAFTSTRARARFEREVALAASLQHPNIARVYHSGLHNGVYFYAMELIDGVRLDQYVRERQPSRRHRVALVARIAHAVAALHDKGIVHRDLKPSNILITADGQPHIIDFGLARSLDNESLPPISMDGEVHGTTRYMSPEQAAGRSEEVGFRSDVYTLGVILYQLVCGELPHGRSDNDFELRRSIIEHEVRRPRHIQPDIDADIDAVLTTALALEPSRRYPSMADFAADLNRYLAGEIVRARPLTLGYLLAKRIRRHRVRFALMLCVLLTLVATFVVSYLHVSAARRRAEDSAEASRGAHYLTRIALANIELERHQTHQVRALLDDCPQELRQWEWYRLDAVSDQSIHAVRDEHTVLDAVIVDGGARVMTFTDDRMVRTRDLGTGAVLSELSLEIDPPNRAAFSPDGSFLAVNQAEVSVDLIDTRTGRRVWTLPVNGHVIRPKFSADGRCLLIAFGGDQMIVCRTDSGQILGKFSVPGSRINVTAIGATGRIVACTGGRTEVWDVATGRSLMNSAGEIESGLAIAIDPNESRIAVINGKGELLLWNLADTARPVHMTTGLGRVCDASFMLDDLHLVAAFDVNAAVVVRVSDGAVVERLEGVPDFLRGVHVVSGDRVMTLSGNAVNVWDLSLPVNGCRRIGREVIGADNRNVELNARDGALFSSDRSPCLMNLVDGTVRRAPFMLSGQFAGSAQAADGSCFAVMTFDDELCVIDRATLERRMLVSSEHGFIWHCLSDDGALLAAAALSNSGVRVWRVADGKEVGAVAGEFPMTFLRHSHTLVCRDPSSAEMSLVDVDRAMHITRSAVDLKGCQLAVVDPTGASIALVRSDGVEVLSTTTWKRTAQLHGDVLHQVSDLAFDPSGARIVTADQKVRLWDSASGTEIMTLDDRSGDVFDRVTFTEDGRSIAAYTRFGDVVIWSSAPNDKHRIKP